MQTDYALRVDDLVIVTGQQADEITDYWVDGNYLCVDCHAPEKSIRRALRFPLGMTPTHPASLFNGFTNTKHDDLKVVVPEDDGVETITIQDEDYRNDGVADMDRSAFWKRAGLV